MCWHIGLSPECNRDSAHISTLTLGPLKNCMFIHQWDPNNVTRLCKNVVFFSIFLVGSRSSKYYYTAIGLDHNQLMYLASISIYTFSPLFFFFYSSNLCAKKEGQLSCRDCHSMHFADYTPLVFRKIAINWYLDTEAWSDMSVLSQQGDFVPQAVPSRQETPALMSRD